MTRRYSALSLLREGLAGHTGWEPAWRSPQPQKSYDAIVIGGGGHGLATAYYLAKTHRLTRVAVLEKGWIGGGNTGRNTTVVRSNYFYPESVALYDLAHRLYKGLAAELNFNVMFSPRGMVTVCHSDAEMEIAARTVNAMQINGVDAELFSAADVRRVAPPLNFSPTARFPIHGGVWQGSAGTARHDAVAWGYARAASRLGVDIIQNCEVVGFIVEGGRCRGVETSLGAIRGERIGMAAAGHSSQLAAMAGFRLPVISYALQAWCPSRSSRSSIPSSCRWERASTSANRTRASWCSAARSTEFPPTRSAAICRSSKTSSPACSRCSPPSASCS